MKLEKIFIHGKSSVGILYDDSDFEKMKDIYSRWKHINDMLESLGSRSLNVPDLLSEGLFCYIFKVYRVNGKSHSSSYDAFDTTTDRGIQIKSCSIDEDCSSFGPRTHWEQIYFMRFYPKSSNGRVEIYDISEFNFDNIVLNKKKGETFKMQQEQGRRPRFSVIKEVINKNCLKPIKVINLLDD